MHATKEILDALGMKERCSGVYAQDWVREPRGEEMVSTDPTTGKPIATILQASAEDYDRVVDSAYQAFLSWRMVPAPRRGEVVRQIGDALRQKKEALGQLVTVEMGKIAVEGMGEVQEMIDVCDFATGLSRQLYGLSMHSERPHHRMYEQWQPLGPVGVVTAFNFPTAVWSWNTAIALACGDSVIWKPSSLTPLTAIAVMNIVSPILARNGCPGVLTLCVGPGRTVGERLLKDRRVPLVSFTGSCSAGKRVANLVGERFGRTILELGGNNAVIVTADANLDLALRAILFGAVGTAGQRCTSTRRVILEKPIAQTFTKRLVDAYKQIRIGDPLDPSTVMGPLVDRSAVDDMMKAIGVIKEQGGEIIFGGKLKTGAGFESGCFVEPTLVKARPDLPMVKEETFAPVLYLIEAKDVEDAIRIQNDVPQGLSSSMFTTNVLSAETFLSARGSDCGIANINVGTSGAEVGGAFGGEKDTGGGRESGSDSWKQYMRRQTCTINWGKEMPLAQGIRFGE